MASVIKTAKVFSNGGEQIDPLDRLIAAHARSPGASAVTGNVSAFGRVPGLEVRNWRAV